MKAVRIHSFGGPHELMLEDMPKPKPGRSEVLIRVEAAGVNPFDCMTRSGVFRDVGAHVPLTIGRDVSGVVEEIGANVSDVKVGDEVFGITHGTYAEYATAKAYDLAPKPASIDHLH